MTNLYLEVDPCVTIAADDSYHGGATIVTNAAEKPPITCPVLSDGANVYALKVGVNSLGRLADCNVIVTDPQVSRRHCVLVVHPDHSCEVYDQDSTNGTYLNGERVKCLTLIEAGDIIRVGDHCFTLHYADALNAAVTEIVEPANV